MYNVRMDAIQAVITLMPVTDLCVTYAVTGPVPQPPRLYKFAKQRILTMARTSKEEILVVCKILEEEIIRDYNTAVEDSPIMDMFDDPRLYKTLNSVHWIIPIDLQMWKGQDLFS